MGITGGGGRQVPHDLKDVTKGISTLSTVLIIMLVGTTIIFTSIYFIYEQSAQRFLKAEEEFSSELDFYKEGYNRLAKFILYKLYDVAEPARPKFEMVLVEVSNFTIRDLNTKAIVFKNVGDSIMTDFKVFLDEGQIITYYTSMAVFPDENGMVILWPSQVQEWQLDKSEIEIRADGVSIKLKS